MAEISPLRIAYLGPEGTYSEEAARQFAGDQAEYVPYPSIDEAVLSAERGEVGKAVVPIANSTEGPVSRTLDLLLQTPLHASGEVLLPIHHQLLSHSPDLAGIQEVAAHPQALAQCRRWLDEHMPHAERRSASSNAQAAAEAANREDIAAIAGRRASELYGLEILASDIEDVPDNATRFLVLDKTDAEATGHDKTSLVCSVPNEAGTLYQLLGILARRDINMTKLESRPSSDVAWDYVFYIDIDGHRTEQTIADALAELEQNTLFTKVIGSYPKAQQ